MDGGGWLIVGLDLAWAGDKRRGRRVRAGNILWSTRMCRG